MKARKQLIATALVLWAGGVLAAQPQEDLNARVTRLERLIEGQALADMLLQIESLQQEIQRLRGQVEEQAHTIQSLQRRQRELYIDIDRRLSRLEQAAAGVDAGAVDDAADSAVDEEQIAYQQAFDLLRELHYEEATAAFHEFLQHFPSGRYAPVAQYWIGEASFAQRDFPTAIAEYQKLVERHPESPKVAEALLKIGTSHHELGDKGAATRVLSDLIARHPDTTEASQARTLLKQIKRGG